MFSLSASRRDLVLGSGFDLPLYRSTKSAEVSMDPLWSSDLGAYMSKLVRGSLILVNRATQTSHADSPLIRHVMYATCMPGEINGHVYPAVSAMLEAISGVQPS